MKLTKDNVIQAHEELIRRLEIEISEGVLLAPIDVMNERCSMAQGMYGTLMVLADNWPDVRNWCDEVEEQMNFWDDPYWKSRGYEEG